MWDADETQEMIDLEKKCPGIDKDILRNLAENSRVITHPWYAVITEILYDDVIGSDTKENLAEILLTQYTIHKDYEIHDIFHDGKAVEWELQLFINE